MRAAAALALTGFSIALWTGAAHLTVVFIVRAIKTDMYWPWSGRDVWWIVPLGYLVVFALPVGILALLHGAGPRVARSHWVFGIWAGLGLFAVLLLYPRAESWSLALLAAGGGAQLGGLYREHEAYVTRVIRRGALSFAAFFALFGGGGALLRAWSSQRTLANLAPKSGTAPNVLLIILDTVRASSMSLYGAVRPTTPRLAAWAKRGVVFDQAYATSSWTLPSHASMFTGMYASQHSADWLSPLDATHRTLAEVLRDHGYATGGFTGNQLAAGYESGIARGFVTYEDTKRTFAEVAGSTTISQGDVVMMGRKHWRRDRWVGGIVRELARFDFRPGAWGTVHDYKSSSDVIQPFLRWQTSLGERPFFAFLNLFDAHAPERNPTAYRSMFNGGATRPDAYDGAVRYLDDQVSDLLDELERRGVLQSTIVIITADHGEHLGERGLYGHGNSLYREVLRVPLIVFSGDSAAAGRRIAAPVSLRDIAATCLDLARLPNDAALPGRSLAEHWRSDLAVTSPLLAEVSQGILDNPKHPTAKGDMAAVLDDSLHIIRNGDGSFEAYAYRTDSMEARNLAVGPALPTLSARFTALYTRALRPREGR